MQITPYLGTAYYQYSYYTALVLTNSSTYLGFSFLVTEENKQAAGFTAYCSVAGGASNLVGLLCADTGGNPDSANPLATATLASPSVGFVTWTFASPVALTVGGRYWIVIKGNASSSTVTFRFLNGWLPTVGGGDPNVIPMCKKHTTTGDAGWANTVTGVGSFAIDFSDGSYWGFPYIDANYPLTTANTKVGAVIVYPAYAAPMAVNVVGLGIRRNNSIPAGDLFCEVYEDGSLIGQSYSSTGSEMTSNLSSLRQFCLKRPIVMKPGKKYIFAIPSGAATGGNYYRLEGIAGKPTNYANPFFGQQHYAIYAAGAWTYDTSKLVYCLLGTLAGQEALPAPLNRRQFNSMR